MKKKEMQDIDAIIALLDGYTAAGESRIKINVLEACKINMKNLKKDKLIKWSLVFAVALQGLLILIANYVKAFDIMDADAALAVRHAVDMWKAGTIFLPDFNYTTSMEIDCAGFLAAPIYLLTGSLGLGYALAHLLLNGLQMALIYRILKNLEVPFNFRLLAILISFTPFRLGQLDWDNMLFLAVGQYQFRVIALLLLFMLLTETKRFGKGQWILLAFCQLMIFVTVLSTGNYLLMTVLAPLVLYEFWRVLQQQKIDFKDQKLQTVLLSTLVAIITFLFRQSTDVASNRTNMAILKGEEFFDNLQRCFTAVFELFNGLPLEDCTILSVGGFIYLTRFLFVCLLFCLIIWGRKWQQSEEEKSFFGRFFVLTAVNLLILIFTDTHYGSSFERRYHILWCSILIIADVVILVRNWERMNRWMQYAAAGCIVMGLALMNLGGFKDIYEETCAQQEVIDNSIRLADQYGVQDIALLNQVAARVTAAKDVNKNVQYLVFNEDYTVYDIYIWGTTKKASVAADNLMVMEDYFYQQMSEEFLAEYEEIAVINGWHYLITHSYPWIKY